MSLARDFTLIPRKTEGDLLQPEFNVYIITPEENLHLVNADEFWHPPANAFLSFLIPDTLLVLVNSRSPRCIILWYVRGLLNSGFCSDAVLCSWACGVVCGWNWKGKQLIWDWALILDVLLPSDKQYEWDIFKEHESVQVHAQERQEQLCPSKFPLLQRAFGRCAFWAGGWHSAWGWRNRGVEITWWRTSVLNQREKLMGKNRFFGQKNLAQNQQSFMQQQSASSFCPVPKEWCLSFNPENILKKGSLENVVFLPF